MTSLPTTKTPCLLPTTSFTTISINPTLIAISEDDEFGDTPIIYLHLHRTSPLLILSDTGCGPKHARVPELELTSLRTYIETFPQPFLGGRAINPLITSTPSVTVTPQTSPERKYVILFTHCHYDHIGGVEQFLSPPGSCVAVLASAADKAFISPAQLPTNSLCRYVGMNTPQFSISYFAADFETLRLRLPVEAGTAQSKQEKGEENDRALVDLVLQIIHTPGHTPDSLSWYSPHLRLLCVGDSFYEFGAPGGGGAQARIIFPPEGASLISYLSSLKKLLVFVRNLNEESRTKERLTICASHINVPTAAGCLDAEEMILAVQAYFVRVVKGEVPVIVRSVIRGVECVTYQDGVDEEGRLPRFAVMVPVRLVEEVREGRG